MKKIIAIAILFFSTAFCSASVMHNYSLLLRKYVSRSGYVNYRAMVKDPLLQRVYQDFRGALSLAGSGRSYKTLLINAYNFFVLYRVKQFYPLRRVIDRKNFFIGSFIPFRGRVVSLNYLEKQILFKLYPDPLLHFVLVCAAKSCPSLRNYPYRASRLRSVLKLRTRRFLRSWHGLRKRGAKIYVSKLFKWYKKDFGGNIKGIRRFLLRHTTLDKWFIRKTEISFSYYDWRLNGR